MIPLVDNDDIVQLGHILLQGQLARDLYARPEQFGEIVIRVRPMGPSDEDNQSEAEPPAPLVFGEISGSTEIASGTQIVVGRSIETGDDWQPCWQIVPFNSRAQRNGRLETILRNANISVEQIKEALASDSPDESLVSQVRSIYSSVPGTLNGNSLLLYSGAINAAPCVGSGTKAPASQVLWTGDWGPADVEIIASFLSGLDAHPGVVTVPHHGSKTSWGKPGRIMGKFADALIWVCQYGQGNGYGHPSRSVVSEIASHATFVPLRGGYASLHWTSCHACSGDPGVFDYPLSP